MSQQATTGQAQPGDAIIVEVGHEELEHGRVRAELRADGRVLVERRSDGESERFEHRLDKDAAEEAFRRADDLGRLAPSPRPDHRPVPDESRYRIELHLADREPFAIEIWQGELVDNDEARKLVSQLADVVQHATDGRALL
jgi:hypothetical protein